MKLTKLSLAAILAAGALSSVSAAPLEEAIKDIDVSGFGRYRFETLKEHDKTADDKSHVATHRFTLDVNFKATLDDNFFSVIGLRYDAFDIAGSHNDEGSGLTNTGLVTAPNLDNTTSLSVRQYYVGYTGIPDTTVLFGRQPAGTFFTDDVVATGLKVANTSIPGVTLAGVFYTNFEDDSDMAQLPFDPRQTTQDDEGKWTVPGPKIQQKNLWGVAAIGSFDWFSFQAWYAGLHRVAHLFAGELAANYAVMDDVSVRGKVQVAHTRFTKTFARNYHYDVDEDTGVVTRDSESVVGKSTFVGVELGASAYGLDADVGAAFYGKKDKSSVHTLEDKGGLINAGEKLLNYTAFDGKHTSFFAKAMYTYDAYSVGLDYVYDKAKNSDDKTTGHEFVARLGYKYNSKLSFKAWYSWVKTKETDNDPTTLTQKDRNDHFRFEARYNF